MHRKHPTLGVAYALLGALLFGLNASSSKVLITSGLSAEVLVTFRSLATASLAAILLAFTNRSAFRVERSEWPRLVVFGVIGVAIMQWAYSNAVANLPIGIALLIEYTAIIFVPIASWVIFKERALPRLWVGVALVIGGLAVVSRIWDGGLSPWGVTAAIIASLTLTVYFVMGQHTQQKRDALSTLLYTMLIAAIFWAFITNWKNANLGQLAQQLNLGGNLEGVEVPGWALLAWVGVFGSFLPMWFSYLALRHLSATGVGIASTAETIFAFIFGWLWLGEKIDGLQTLGGLLVISGIVIAQTSRGKTKWQQSN